MRHGRPTVVRMAAGAGALASFLLAGCRSPAPGPTEWTLEPGAYTQAFEAARDVLRDQGFSVDRVDARAGVITTAYKPTAGLGTPRDLEQSTATDELRDLANRGGRVVQVRFAPAGAEASQAGLEDLRACAGPVAMNVEATRYRAYLGQWQVETSSIQLSSRASDPAREADGTEPEVLTRAGEDRALAARITRLVRARAQVQTSP